MVSLYGKLWVSIHGAEPSEEWIRFLNGLGELQINRMFVICHSRLFNGVVFPPVLGEFITAVDQRTKTEVEEAYSRFLSKTPQGRAEKWVISNADWNLRRATAGTELDIYTKYLRQADELEKRGNLILAEEELRALPRHTSIAVTDKAREEYSKSGKTHKLSERIERLKKLSQGK